MGRPPRIPRCGPFPSRSRRSRVLGVLLLFHPRSDGRVYDGVSDDVTRWLVVHLGLAVLAGAMGLAG
jgi:hypothetical protein